MDQTAIDRIAQLAVAANQSNQLETFLPAIVLRDAEGAETLNSLERFDAHRARFRGRFNTTSIHALAEYTHQTAISRGAPGEGFIDVNGMTARIYFNLHTPEGKAGHADHFAEVKLETSAAYGALMKYAHTPLDQRALHDFLEDWNLHITALYNGEPDASKPLSAALAAIRSITVETARQSTSDVRDMGSTRSAMETVDARSKHTLPSGFIFECQPYAGLPSVPFHLRLGVTTGDDKVSLILRVQQREAIREAIGENFRRTLENLVGQDATLLLGTFTP